MVKKEIGVLFLFFLFLVLTFKPVNGDEKTVLVSNNNLYLADKTRIYGIVDEKFAWTYYDEGYVSSLELIDWNYDAINDLVVASNSQIIPKLKIIDGKTGKLLDSFLVTEKTFIGNTILTIKNVNVVGSEIFFSSDQILYKISNNQPKIIAIFGNTINQIKTEYDQLEVMINKGMNVEKYNLDINGKILSKTTLSLEESQKLAQEKSDCLSGSGFSGVISGIKAAQGQYYCTDDFIYYLNASMWLIKRDLSGNDWPLWQVSCSESPQVIAEKVVQCGNFIFINGKKIIIPSTTNFLTFYDGEKEFIISKFWPFEYKYGGVSNNFDYSILKDSKITSISSNLDFDQDGNKDLLLILGDEQGATALLFFELKSKEEKLISLILTEKELQDTLDNLGDQLGLLNSSINSYNKVLSKLQNDINANNSIRDSVNNQIISTQSSIQITQQLKSAKAQAGLNTTEEDKKLDQLNSQLSDLNKQYSKLNEEMTSSNNQFIEISQKKEKAENDFYKTQNEISDIKNNPIRYIRSFDICDGKVFITTDNRLYSFSTNLVSKKIENIENAGFVSCAKGSGGKKDLLIFSYNWVYLTKQDGSLIKKSDFNATMNIFTSALRINAGENIYLPIQSGDNLKVLVYDFNGQKLDEKEFDMNGYSKVSLQNNELVFCNEGGYNSLKMVLISQDISYFNYNFPYQVRCDDIILNGCGKNEIVLVTKSGDKIKLNCLEAGTRDVSTKKEITATGGTGDRKTKKITLTITPTAMSVENIEKLVPARIVGDYIIAEKSDESFHDNMYFYGSKAIEPEFPYQVYDINGKRVVVSLEPVFVFNNKLINYQGDSIVFGNLITTHGLVGNKYLLSFARQGDKIIFVNGEFYDSVSGSQAVLKLIPGEHQIRAYLYDNGYYFDEIKINIPYKSNFSFFSFLIVIVFISGIIVSIILILKK